MSATCVAITAIFSILMLVASVSAQEKADPLDDYINKADMIALVRCTRVGPMNILMRAAVELEVLHVVKGKPDITRLLVDSQYGMAVGERYLVRIPKLGPDHKGGRVNDRESVIPLSQSESIEELKALSTRIVVLRTMNLRIHQLESDISEKMHELEALKAVKKGN